MAMDCSSTPLTGNNPISPTQFYGHDQPCPRPLVHNTAQPHSPSHPTIWGQPEAHLPSGCAGAQPPSNDASDASINPAITTNSSSKSGRSKNGGRTREEFSLKDVNQLLRMVIKVNPYMALRNQIGIKWKEIEGKVKAEGFCKGRDVNMLKNKVVSLLNWVEVSFANFFFFFIY
jgi:hypothetical protein